MPKSSSGVTGPRKLWTSNNTAKSGCTAVKCAAVVQDHPTECLSLHTEWEWPGRKNQVEPARKASRHGSTSVDGRAAYLISWRFSRNSRQRAIVLATSGEGLNRPGLNSSASTFPKSEVRVVLPRRIDALHFCQRHPASPVRRLLLRFFLPAPGSMKWRPSLIRWKPEYAVFGLSCSSYFRLKFTCSPSTLCQT